MENVATYSEARSEYTKQLATFIVPTIVGWFQTLWSRNAGDRQRCLSLFQNECEEVSRWNQDRIHDEVRVLLERSGCDYMEELVTAVFIAHTKVLTAVRLSAKQKKLSITVPKLDHFLHRVFRESARSFWKTPFLFMADGGVVDRQKNLLQIEALASEAITTAVRGLLPVKQILQDYLGEDEEEEVVDETVLAEVKAEPESKPEAESKPESKVESKSEPESKPEPEPESKAEPESGPSVVSIDTEPAVHFSEYDTVFDATKGAPELRYSPKDENEDMDDGPSDALSVNESSAAPLSADDAEDLDAPMSAPAVARTPAPTDKLSDDDFVVLE